MSRTGYLLTTLGCIRFELEDVRAPESCRAFVRSVECKEFDGGEFNRVVHAENDNGAPPIEIVQALVRWSSPFEWCTRLGVILRFCYAAMVAGSVVVTSLLSSSSGSV